MWTMGGREEVVELKTHRPEWDSHRKGEGGSAMVVAPIPVRGVVLQRPTQTRGLQGLWGCRFLCFGEEGNGGEVSCVRMGKSLAEATSAA
jgi:hypothetical protein